MCRNNFNNHSLGKIIDLDVIYTGCGGVIGDVVITPNMTLREVLDAIITNFTSPKPGTQWYIGDDVPTFPANDGDLYLRSDGHVWEYDLTAGWQETDIVLGGGGTGGGAWGTITGNIQDQTDLITLINASIENYVAGIAGRGLSYDDTDEKINVGSEHPAAANVYQIPFPSNSAQYLIGLGGADENVDIFKPAIIGSGTQIGMSDAGTGNEVTVSNTSVVVGNFSGAYSQYSLSDGSYLLSADGAQMSINGTLLCNAQTSVAISTPSSYINLGAQNVSFGTISAATFVIEPTKTIIRTNLEFDILSSGPVIKSPDGTKRRITVDNAGVLSTVVVS